MAPKKRIHVDDEGIEKIGEFFESAIRKLVNPSDNEIKDRIDRIKSLIREKAYSSPDKGAELRENLKALEAEQERRIQIEIIKKANIELQAENERLREELRDKDEALEKSQELNNVLIVKEHQQNELLQIREVLIRGIGESSSQHIVVRVREMGELDRKPFLESLKDKCNSFSEEEVSVLSESLYSFWEKMLKNKTWHPFKVTLVDGKQQEVVDEGDGLLKGLKNEWGEKVYDAVVNALVELNEYNPSGGRPVQDLWNFEQKRRATLTERVSYAVHRLEKHPSTMTTTMATPLEK